MKSVVQIVDSKALQETKVTDTKKKGVCEMNAVRQTAQKPLRVRHYVAGGEENGGGIGRLVGYIRQSGSQADHRVTDTRGPWFSPMISSIRLAQAILTMAGTRIVSPQTVHHIHVAGRGSTRRKLILSACARSLGCIHMLHLHDYDYAADLSERSPRQIRAIRRMFDGADRVLVLGQRDRRTIFDLLDNTSQKVTIQHNAVPDPGVAPASNKSKSDPIRLLFLGQLGPRKGVPELLRALADPALSQLPWQAVLAGDGPVDKYQEEAKALGLGDRVTFTGWLKASQVEVLCRKSDILVLPSHGEGMAMAVLEGLAHGLTVVTTPVGAHTEVLTDGVTGVFVPVGNVKALADTLGRLIMHDKERSAISQAGRAHYLWHFSIAAYAARLDPLYRSTVQQARAGRDVRADAT